MDPHIYIYYYRYPFPEPTLFISIVLSEMDKFPWVMVALSFGQMDKDFLSHSLLYVFFILDPSSIVYFTSTPYHSFMYHFPFRLLFHAGLLY